MKVKMWIKIEGIKYETKPDLHTTQIFIFVWLWDSHIEGYFHEQPWKCQHFSHAVCIT